MITANQELLKRVAKVKKGDKERLGALMTRVVLTTQNKEIAEGCVNWAQWTKEGKGYSLSLLGFINGILDELTGGKVLIKHIAEEDKGDNQAPAIAWEIGDKWWGKDANN